MSETWIVVNTPQNWDFDVPGVRVLSAREYVTDEALADKRDVRVYNLSRSYRYQSLGYYVSLLAEARGHRPMPTNVTLQDMRSTAVIRQTSDDLDALIKRTLKRVRASDYTLSIYFGQNMAKQNRALALALFNQFAAPLLRAQFERGEDGWELRRLTTISAREVPESHRGFVADAAVEFFSRRIHRRPGRRNYRYDLAILHNPEEVAAPSNKRALERFVRAAEKLQIRPTFVERDDYGRISEFDALFLRETTYVNHHTFRFASRAAAAGLVVIDDPQSIIRCTNKVFVAEALTRHGIGAPKTVILHRDNLEPTIASVDYPCILKRPDSSFSQGVIKVNDGEELRVEATQMLKASDLLILQEFVPTEFDWRIGVLGGKPLYACRYYMAKRHWQIIDWKGKRARFGASETIPIADAPARVVKTAVRAAKLMGDGLYGVDLKEIGRRLAVIEVNDNPSLDAGVEDLELGARLYERIMEHFVLHLDRLHHQRRGS